ncbi:MAG: hypothetical protein M3Z96_15120, partial [Pseudomonadota bacterium]|nr:hypothetical protein [Pseudomonadota bacterium]
MQQAIKGVSIAAITYYLLSILHLLFEVLHRKIDAFDPASRRRFSFGVHCQPRCDNLREYLPGLASYGISRFMPRLAISVERFPILENFVISRGAKTEAAVVEAAIEDGAWRGRGEGVPYPRYGETVDSVLAQMGSVRSAIEAGADRVLLQTLLPPGAARNAIDCALWDLAAKRS